MSTTQAGTTGAGAGAGAAAPWWLPLRSTALEYTPMVAFCGGGIGQAAGWKTTTHGNACGGELRSWYAEQAAKQSHLVRNDCDAPSSGRRRQRGQGRSRARAVMPGGRQDLSST
ncbi:hypothetical protein V500_08479 [Pseudogymnoascus sp. VKM F-4518 (FW-2643)]|nr:hypothetical protein V500_08479 [Pseudogymnoascus sp. VKM F-4518 (FW-2643)]